MVGFPLPIHGLGYSPMLPWLPDLAHLPPPSLKRLTRALPGLQARLETLVAGELGSDHEGEGDDGENEGNEDDEELNRMDVGDSPSKRSSGASGGPVGGEPAFILTGIKVRLISYRVADVY